MTEPVKTPSSADTPVTDRRTPPRGVMPRQIQTWLMSGLAIGMLGIIFFSGQSVRRPRTDIPAAPTGVLPDTGRLRDVQERLRGMNDRAQEQQENDPVGDDGVRPVNTHPSTTADPFAAERKRKDYESLFAGLTVQNRDGAEQVRPAGAGALASESRPGRSSLASAEQILETAVRNAALGALGMAPDASAPSADGSVRVPTAAQTSTSAQPSSPDQLKGRHRLTEGTLIPAVLTNRLDGSAAGPVNCLVTSPVYDSTGQRVLIPAGARLLGRTTPVQSFGETRLAVAFHRLAMPNGTTYTLDRVVGLNQAGDTGLRDQVNQHYLATFGAASAVGLLSGLSQAFGARSVNADGPAVVVAGGAGDANAQAGTRVLDRFLNRPPTLTIREGHRVQVYLTADLDLPSYTDERIASQMQP
jgi:type IV secretory pathway VirB10-like protein